MPYADPQDPRATAARRKWYYENRERAGSTRRAKVEQLRAEMVQIKESSPCTDCGVSYPYYVMQFDHLADKELTPSRLVTYGSLAKMRRELAKCELVCANCHAARTYRRMFESAVESA